jgi:hypothetical protein
MYQPINVGAAFRPEFVPRIRKEKNAQQTYIATEAVNRPRVYGNNDIEALTPSQRTPFMDMAPISSRSDTRDVRQSQPYVPQVNTPTGNNPYFTKFDVTQDPRNVTREMQGAVYEERGRKQSKALVQRGFQHAWVDEAELKKEVEERLRGAEVMRPSQTSLISRTENSLSGWNASGSVGAGATHW